MVSLTFGTTIITLTYYFPDLQLVVQDQSEPDQPSAPTLGREEVLVRDLQAQVRTQNQPYAAYALAHR